LIAGLSAAVESDDARWSEEGRCPAKCGRLTGEGAAVPVPPAKGAGLDADLLLHAARLHEKRHYPTHAAYKIEV
jgi:hypothetical protein